MSAQFVAYFAIAATACLVALLLVRPRNAFDLSRCVSWYLLTFIVTYLLRPAGSQMIGDTILYSVLHIGSFEEHWHLMAIAVPLAILSFAVGYHFATAPGRGVHDPSSSEHAIIGGAKALTFSYWLMAWGYVVTLLTINQSGAETGATPGAPSVTFEHNTAWFAQGDVYVSTGSTLYYILTGRLWISLLLAGPWLAARVVKGFGRINIVGHFMALVAVHFGRAARSEHYRPKRTQVVLLMLTILVVAIVAFPVLAMTRRLGKETSMSMTDIFEVAMRSKLNTTELLAANLGTNSSLAGFEPSLYHILVDSRPKLGTWYLYFYFIQPIPRIVWPGKGVVFDWPLWLLGVDWDPTVAILGMAPGSIGGAFEQWGWLGIPGEFLFTGWLIGWAEEKARRRTDAAYIQLAYVGLYTLMPQLGRDSILYMIASRFLFVYGIPVFVLWCIHKRATAQARRVATVKTPAPPLGRAVQD